jgi:hypothetical protein
MKVLKLNNHLKKLLLVFGLFGAIVLVVTGLALAHETRELGEYNLVFGWRVEPAITNYPNGPEVYIRLPEGAEGDITELLADMDVALQVEVTFGPASKTLDLRRDFRAIDHYIADLIPTRPGDYTFRVFGNIGDFEVDEVFTSADGRFGTVEPASDVMFPEPLPALDELLERIAALEARIAELEGE